MEQNKKFKVPGFKSWLKASPNKTVGIFDDSVPAIDENCHWMAYASDGSVKSFHATAGEAVRHSEIGRISYVA